MQEDVAAQADAGPSSAPSGADVQAAAQSSPSAATPAPASHTDAASSTHQTSSNRQQEGDASPSNMSQVSEQFGEVTSTVASTLLCECVDCHANKFACFMWA